MPASRWWQAVQRWIATGLERDTVIRSIKTSLVVGILLALVNHWQHLFPPQFTGEEALQIALTYLVPYGVATYGQVSGKLQREGAATAPSPEE